MLDDLGLLPALLWLFERYMTQTAIRVTCKHAGVDRRFAPEVETAAYRIVQEALTNVARYAGVREVTVRLWLDGNRLHVQVEDEGGGFDADAALTTNASSGLAGMRERAMLLGGDLTMESTIGVGTRLTAALPLRPVVALAVPAGHDRPSLDRGAEGGQRRLSRKRPRQDRALR